MAGRTLNKYARVYVDGYDLSGYSRSISPLTLEFEPIDLTVPMGDAAMGYLPNKPVASPGTLNTVFDNTATVGAHAVLSAQNDDRVVLVALGDRAAPVAGNPAFMGEFLQTGYHAEEDGGAMIANLPFSSWEAESLIDYGNPWGVLAHALSAADSDGSDSDDFIGDSDDTTTAFGGYMVWHVTAGDGTATITMEHSATTDDSDAAAIGGLTTGEIDFSSRSTGVAVTTATTTSINQYVRWNISMNTASTVTFVLGFCRGLY